MSISIKKIVSAAAALAACYGLTVGTAYAMSSLPYEKSRVFATPSASDGVHLTASAPKNEVSVDDSLFTHDDGEIYIKEINLCGYGKSEEPKICWNNQTKIKIDANDFKNIKNPVKTADYSKPTVLIYHTHGTESYASGASYPPGYMFKSSDTEKNMIAVGNIFAAALEAHGIGVIHDKTMHDKNSYNGSYNSSEAAIKEIVKKNPTIKYTIDMHRDSVNQNGAERKIVAEIEGKKCAQIMFVVGTGHKNWKTNMAVATALQAVINEKYPTMARPIFLRTSDFNQTHAEGGMLFEVGAAGNTLEEAKNTAYFTAQALAEMIKSS